ncbi:Protoporphyrinogen oxidase [Testicularia cyperi]|uniref:Protoporphyrinogen oxidase n=1 Tax=Testicularia cyperi TaxID=1882483 RepID=A0A317XLN8_9BASI|nr:Protoporphyrinogen oxidase [Testicularia cyperi]
MMLGRGLGAVGTSGRSSNTGPTPWSVRFSHRTLSTSSSLAAASQQKRKIAVLGGGISGLTSAYRLSQKLPRDRYDIVLLEKKPRLGGWIQSERVQLPSVSTKEPSTASLTALIEKGPRSIRPAGYSGLMMLELLQSLDLLERLLKVPKTAPSAQNRFIYYPDRLAKLPSSISSLFSALFKLPFLRAVIPGVLREPRVSSRFLRPRSESVSEKTRLQSREALEDESVDSFVSRRFGKGLAENLVSAIIHGIYAGDTRRLSVRAVLPFLWDAERVHGSVLRSMLPTARNKRYRPLPAPEAAAKASKEERLKDVEARLGKDLVQSFKGISVYSFPDGVQEIVDALEARLAEADNVQLLKGDGVDSILVQGEGDIRIRTISGQTITVDRIVSSLPSTQLAKMLPEDEALPQLAHNPAANVGVVNIVMQPTGSGKSPLPVEGFGYLIPRSTPANEDGILGVVFDSDSLPTQDTADATTKPIKLTVMMGGSHWTNTDSLPSEAQMKQRAVKAVSQHLGIPREALEDESNTIVIATMQRDCIPWYLVGHPIRMAQLHKALQQHPTLAGKLTLTGASYTGVSLNDCVAYASEAVERIVSAETQDAHKVVTGLEGFDVCKEKTLDNSHRERISNRAASPRPDQAQGLLGPTSTNGTTSFKLARALHTGCTRRSYSTAPSSTPPSGGSSSSSPPSSSATTLPSDKPSKSLGEILIDSIKASGPMPVSTYMRTCLLDPMQGYYSSANAPAGEAGSESREVLGSRGDFITSPEISQVFGELVAIFYLARWQSVGSPSQVRLIELGPGKGTLLADMLRTFASFKPFIDSVKTIQLVETSDGLMRLQLEAITNALAAAGKKVVDADTVSPGPDEVVVEWFPTVDMVPVKSEQFTILTAHEFFDALPTHIFEKHTDGTFREVLVGIKPKSSITVLKPSDLDPNGAIGAKKEKDELGFVLSPGPSPWGQMLVQNNPRFKYLKPGQRVEVSPESWAVARRVGELIAGRPAKPAPFASTRPDATPEAQSQATEAEAEAERIRQSTPTAGGAGLVIDYGDDKAFGSSFRAFKQHNLVPVFENPGSVDLTVNVDFLHLKSALATTDAEYRGPLDQADFLVAMGLEMRTNKLIQDKSDDDARRITSAANRLVDQTGMGTQYKALAILADAKSANQDADSQRGPDLYPFDLITAQAEAEVKPKP